MDTRFLFLVFFQKLYLHFRKKCSKIMISSMGRVVVRVALCVYIIYVSLGLFLFLLKKNRPKKGLFFCYFFKKNHNINENILKREVFQEALIKKLELE